MSSTITSTFNYDQQMSMFLPSVYIYRFLSLELLISSSNKLV